jgi:hypothetical protein
MLNISESENVSRLVQAYDSIVKAHRTADVYLTAATREFESVLANCPSAQRREDALDGIQEVKRLRGYHANL